MRLPLLFLVLCINILIVHAQSVVIIGGNADTVEDSDEPVSALISEYVITQVIAEDSVHLAFSMTFEQAVDTTLVVPLPPDAYDVRATVDGIELESSSTLILPLRKESRTAEFSFVIPLVYSEEKFNWGVSEFSVPFSARHMKVEAILPEQSSIAPMLESEEESAHPDVFSTDGERVILVWEWQDLEAGSVVNPLVLYEAKSAQNSSWWYGGFLLFMLLIIGGLFFHMYTNKEKSVSASDFLKGEEKAVYNVLKQKGGNCYQSTLSLVTGIPKATLCKIIMDMEERSIVTKEHKGKRNIVHLNKA